MMGIYGIFEAVELVNAHQEQGERGGKVESKFGVASIMMPFQWL